MVDEGRVQHPRLTTLGTDGDIELARQQERFGLGAPTGINQSKHGACKAIVAVWAGDGDCLVRGWVQGYHPFNRLSLAYSSVLFDG